MMTIPDIETEGKGDGNHEKDFLVLFMLILSAGFFASRDLWCRSREYLCGAGER